MITYHVKDGVGGGVGPRLVNPLLEAREAPPVRYVVDDDDTMRAAVVTCRQCSKPFLAGLIVAAGRRIASSS